jgi:signal transduction histidine kinase
MTDSEDRHSGLKLHKLIEASRVINSTLDLDRLLVLIVEMATQSVGADRGTLYLVDDARKELWSKVLQGMDLVEIRLPFGRGLAGYVAQTGESILIPDAYRDSRFNPDIDRKTGYRTCTVLCMPLKDREGRTIGVFQLLNKLNGCFDRDDEEFIDALSAHAAVAIDHAQMAREMVHHERLSAVGRMASSMIHDFKSPMGTLRLYAETLKMKARDEESRELADEIVRQADRFLGMTREILDFTRGGGGALTLQDVELGAMMDSFLHFLEKDLERNKVLLEKDVRFRGPVRMDQDKMRRVFDNIVSNARDAMPKGGTLRVSTAGMAGQVRIEFADTGAGMPDEVRRRIGEPFLTHGKKHGTGLGMAMVKKVVDEHRGTVEVQSEPGAGTKVSVTLPVKQ